FCHSHPSGCRSRESSDGRGHHGRVEDLIPHLISTPTWLPFLSCGGASSVWSEGGAFSRGRAQCAQGRGACEPWLWPAATWVPLIARSPSLWHPASARSRVSRDPQGSCQRVSRGLIAQVPMLRGARPAQ